MKRPNDTMMGGVHDSVTAEAEGVALGAIAPGPLAESDAGGRGVEPRSRRLIRSIPRVVWLVAVVAAAVHMAPYLRAAAQTPAGWTFTANLSASPDYMQYRVWMRQTQEEGVFVSNRFTAESNERHLPVLLYWTVGRLATVTGLTPEWAYAWLGAGFAGLFVVLLYVTVRQFAPGARATAWIFAALLLGGGLGGYIKLIEEWDWARGFTIVNALLFRPLAGPDRIALFEEFRGNYIVQALFDTHFLLFWLLSLAAVVSLYATVRRFSYARLASTAALFWIGAFLHIYEGLTLLLIAAGALFMCWRKGLPGRTALVIGGTCAVAAGSCLLMMLAVFRMSGAATPAWQGLNVLPSILLLAYPLAWALIAWGGIRYWTNAGMDGAFLIGWAAGCLTLVAAGPFFPYPDRGTMTLQIPLFLVAGSIFFATRARVGVTGAVVVLLLLGSTPVWLLDSWIERTTFKAHETHKWMANDHVAMTVLLRERATSADVLLADNVPLRWLAPEYPGRHYAGHFFLTHRFEQKQRRLRAFYDAMDAQQRAEFLRSERIRFVYAGADQDRAGIAAVAGVHAIDVRPFGTLFEVTAASRDTQ